MKKYACIILVLLFQTLLLNQCKNSVHSEISERHTHASLVASDTAQNSMNNVMQSRVSGEYMKAFLVAYDAFKEDPEIPERKRRIENYNLDFNQSGEFYIVYFEPKREPTEHSLKGGETELGREVSYTISRRDYKIVARKFYK